MRSDKPFLRVAAAIIRRADGSVLLSRRPEHKHQGGCWEFPGGKCEAGESDAAALAREIDEELGLTIRQCRPFMTIDHDYPELSVRLCFREVLAFSGEPCGREGQPVQWFAPEHLPGLSFPAANRPVVTALTLPDRLLILPTPLPENWPDRLSAAIRAGAGLVYLRGVTDEKRLRELVDRVRLLGGRSLVADDVALMQRLGADGLHLTEAGARACQTRPEVPLLSMACHDQEGLERARNFSVDLATLSPVAATVSHPQAAPLGWSAFRQLVEGCPFPVYALGGVRLTDLDQARRHGARGIAGIRDFWNSHLA